MLENIVAIWTLLADTRFFLVLAALAAFRLAELVAIDEGPFDMFYELRSWANDCPINNRNIKRSFSNALTCVHCAGMYFALFIVIAYVFSPKITALIIFPSAIAGLQSIIASRFGRQAK